MVPAGTTLQFCVKDWLVERPDEVFRRVLRQLEDARFDRPYSASMRMMAAFVYCSNEMEGTLPRGVEEHETCALIERVAEASCEPSDVAAWRKADGTHWDADGARDSAGARQQFVQHMRALLYLFSRLDAPMTVDLVLDAHAILMAGALCNGKDVAVGVLRNHSYHDGSGHVYPDGDPPKLQEALVQIVEAYNVAAATRAQTPEVLVVAPTRIFYDVITLHPFSDGNGRLCRLLFAFAVRQLGVPFAVPLTSGHRKARQHYMRAIQRARRGHFDELQTLALVSIDKVLLSFEDDVRLMGDA